MRSPPAIPSPSPLRGFTRRMASSRGGWLALILAAMLLLTPGCDHRRHYKVLSFFFDGVPHPDGDQADADSDAVDARGRTIAQVSYLYHQPYVSRQCAGCHDPTTNFDTIRNDASLCESCHTSHVQPVAQDWVHGAVVFGDCGRCHEPHYAEHEGLLKTPQPQVCFDCHDQGFIEQDDYHGQLDDLTCSRCHDPHAAGNRLLLVDSRSYQRRRNSELMSEHTGWTRETCRLCHLPERGNMVIDDVTPVCLSCHEQAMTPSEGEGPLHQAVMDGACTTCHDPHRSIKPALVRATAEKICVGCHKPEELPRPQHPVVIRGDCLMCHRGHVSDRPALLRPNIRVRSTGSLATMSSLGSASTPEAGP